MSNAEEMELRQLLWIARERSKCEAKVLYWTEETAAFSAWFQWWKAKNEPGALRLKPYRCRWCRQWHLTKGRAR